jgi:hypothetical protein
MTETGKTLVGAVLMAAVLAAAAGFALWRGGDDPARRQAVALAAATAGVGGLGGWFVGRWSRGRPAAIAVAGSLGAILVRSFLPLATLAWLTPSGGALRAAGAAGLVVAFYLAVLATDVLATIISGRKG